MGTERDTQDTNGNRQEVGVSVDSEPVIRKLTIMEAFESLLDELDLTELEVKVRSRKRVIREKRQMIMYLLAWYGFSEPKIGDMFGMNPATVHHAKNVVKEDVKYDQDKMGFVIRMQHSRLRKHPTVITVQSFDIVEKASQVKLQTVRGIVYFCSNDDMNEYINERKAEAAAKHLVAEVEAYITYTETKNIQV